MKLRFRRFAPEDVPAIERLNARLRAAELPHVVGRESPAQPADDPDAPIRERLFVAHDGEAGEVRGAVWLREQTFACREGAARLGWMIYPVSESLCDRRFAGVPGTLLFGLLREQPRLMALGMGGAAGPFTRLLEGARWSRALVPFWFRVERPERVLRQLSRARATPARRLLADVAAGSGLARLAGGIVRAARGSAGAAGEVGDAFGPWADALWETCRERYSFVAVRDRASLACVHPAQLRPLERLCVRGGGDVIGVACVQAIDAAGTWLAAHFGDLRVGVVTDVFGDPVDARRVFGAAVRRLVESGAELIVSNQSHPAWCAAARAHGFWQGPSTLAFSWSPGVARLLPDDPLAGGVHLTRADGDGPEGVDTRAPGGG